MAEQEFGAQRRATAGARTTGVTHVRTGLDADFGLARADGPPTPPRPRKPAAAEA